ncbi:hypothetical protein SAMN04488550_2797 [Gordonia malaquae]|nr:hypothetical protein SAMN04488550_2797 [Gordonia malaquae]
MIEAHLPVPRMGFEIVRWDWTVAKLCQVAARVRPYSHAAGLL